MTDEKKVVYRVKCALDESHKFSVVVLVKDRDEKDRDKDTFDAYCPYCGKYVRATIQEKLVPDKVVYRSLGFDGE